MLASFPFSAIVGQDMLKRALLLGVIQPSLGGVLIRGTKGVAKSTAVRALASLLPAIETLTGCPFQRRPGEVIAGWPLPPDAASLVRPVPLVELPLGATEDRVLGSLHLEKALRGERTFEPGILAAANRGLLYVDEVNLLPDHLVDILLDAAASGMHRVERDGISLSHPAQFLLVGTMNPEEGDLRPQLLDRFGLAVDVGDLTDPDDRAEAVRRRLAFDADSAGFSALWQAADAAEAERIVQGQRLLPHVQISAAILTAITKRCLAAGVDGLRADLTLSKAACAWAAYQGRTEVLPEDVDAVAELALAHRRTRPPEPPDGMRSAERGMRIADQKEPAMRNIGAKQSFADFPKQELGNEAGIQHSSVFDIGGTFTARIQPRTLARSVFPGRRRQGQATHRPIPTRNVRYQPSGSLAWLATLQQAAPHQSARGRGPRELLRLHPEDLRSWPKRGPGGCLLFFVVDASGSMAAWRRMRQTKAVVWSLLLQAYRQRDRVALLAFRDSGTEMILPPSRGLRKARLALEALPVGGTTPLAHGLAAARHFIRLHKRRQPPQPIWTVILTDGRANVALDSGDPWQSALAQARTLASCGSECLVVDTETGWPRFGRALVLARALAAPCVPLERVLGTPLQFRLSG